MAQKVVHGCMRYFLPSEITSMTKEEICLQGALGLKSCKTVKDASDILLDVWEIAQDRERDDPD